MGLCKCPQRKVTNIFCYEHRVNVCEHCLMQNHPTCVVDTYRNWITDSVFSPKCSLCTEDLVNGETIRLLCFHIVHWACLDSWAKSLPPTTAPAGYTCPVCNRMCLFPALNQVSPIADALRSKMGEVNWARAGLGLPLLNDDIGNGVTAGNNILNNGVALKSNSNSPASTSPFGSAANVNIQSEIAQHGRIENSNQTKTFSSMAPGTHSTNSVMKNSTSRGDTSFPSSSTFSSTSPQSSKSYYGDISVGDSSSNPNPRKPINKDYEMPLLFDEDEHKYRRKSPFEALSRFLRNANPSSNRRKSRKRTIVYALITIIIVIVMFMVLFGRSEDYDEGFDPKLNPNVFIGDREAVGKNVGHEDS